MCFGFNGRGALRRSIKGKGIDRRGFLRGAAATAGAGLIGAGASVPAAAGQSGRPVHVPPGQISIQLWTVRDDLSGPPGFDATLTSIAELGYTKVEQALGYFGRTAEQLRAFYDGIGISCTSSHDGISPDQAALDTKIANAVALGQRFIVVPFLNSDALSDWQMWAEQMNTEAEAAHAAGLEYGYHNHAHEFTIDLGGGLTPWEVLTSELDPSLVHLEIDIYWAVTGGINSVGGGNGEAGGDDTFDPEGFTIDVMRSAPQQVLQYHVKDRDADDGDMVDLGTGHIDFERIFRAHRVKEYIVENDTPDVTPMQSAEVGYDYLRTLGRCH